MHNSYLSNEILQMYESFICLNKLKLRYMIQSIREIGGYTL